MQNQTLHGSPPPSVAGTFEVPASFSGSIIGATRTLRSGYGQPTTIRSPHRVTSDTGSDAVSVQYRSRLGCVSVREFGIGYRRFLLGVLIRWSLRGFGPGSPNDLPG
ncbi:hypothetical protein OPAG_07576 [Rhodococcus opacus PD630]|nr:hypothetical protein OPAG_07576 [Rhodococcus opacus PD630]PBC56083.1 hypothetical protein CJ177_21560 [Rhodococcus sp. ACPA1]RZK70343.1 MAG: hypothetical protein EOP25_09415 [Rhodococcus sp. (in: high G+C Gram-positive bacteria)]